MVASGIWVAPGFWRKIRPGAIREQAARQMARLIDKRVKSGVELSGIAMIMARLVGIALIGLGVACWKGGPLVGMIIYRVAAALYLAYVGFSGGPSGMLLWPAVGVHVVLAALLSRGLSKEIHGNQA